MALGAMAEDNDDSDFTKSLTEALRLRSDYLRGQADHLTLPAVRRLLERDLGLRTSELDVHKALIKRLVDKVLNGEDAADVIEKPRKRRKNNARVVDDEGEPESGKPHVGNTEKKRRLSEDGTDVQEKAAPIDEEALTNMDDSRPPENDCEENGSKESEAKPEAIEKENENTKSEVKIDDDSIKRALMRRSDELKAQAESITVNHVRRLLEDDLGLEPNKLDLHKTFIRNLVYELLESKNVEAAHTCDEKDEALDEEKPKKVLKGKSKKHALSGDLEEKGDAYSTGTDSEGDRKRKVLKKITAGRKKTDKEVKKPAEPKKPFGREVERLRVLCKTLDLGIPPAAYAKAKQAPKDERDEVLIKELEAVLSRVGCPPNPSPTDIRRAKAHLRKKRDLDGIDDTNIVSEPRRNRASANSWFTPKPTNRYLQDAAKREKTSEAAGMTHGAKLQLLVVSPDPDDEGKPKVTGRMDDYMY